MQIGQKIKKLRELKNYTQEYMAAQLEMSVSNYSRLERNEISITLDKLQLVSEALGVDYLDILTFDEKNVFNFINSLNGPNSQGYVFHQSNHSTENLERKVNSLEKKIEALEKLLKNKQA